MASGPHPTSTAAAAAAASAVPSAGGSSSGTATTTTTTTGGILIGDRLYSEVSLTIDHSLIPEERLSPTPSMQDGLDLPSETDLRILGCELIQAAGILLRLPQVGGPRLPAALPGSAACPARLPAAGRRGTGPAGAAGAPGGGRGKGGERRRHKMAAAPGAGPPDPCAPLLVSSAGGDGDGAGAVSSFLLLQVLCQTQFRGEQMGGGRRRVPRAFFSARKRGRDGARGRAAQCPAAQPFQKGSGSVATFVPSSHSPGSGNPASGVGGTRKWILSPHVSS